MKWFYLFGYDEFDTHNGGMGDYLQVFDKKEDAQAAILSGEFNCYEIMTVNPETSELEFTRYIQDQRWLTADGYWTSEGFENNPVRWVNSATRENLVDGIILKTPYTSEELAKQHESDPGTKNNPLPVPQDILNGSAFWRGMDKGNGLFWCRDDGKYYQYPEADL